ncbi:MAG: hypothetical protein FJ202_04220 [Gemmatimonadetes bacterium]|nr:hypothetical protein [Gemmatimonadota bacterium]
MPRRRALPVVNLAVAFAAPVAATGAATGAASFALAVAAVFASATRVEAQQPVEIRTLPQGTLRTGIGGEWTRAPEAYTRNGLQPLGRRFSFDSLGAAQLASLGPIELAARNAAGDPGFRATLGDLRTIMRRNREVIPLTVAYGVTSRLTIDARVEYATAATRVDALIGAVARAANVGLSPALGSTQVAASNAALVAQLTASSASLTGRIATCTAQPATVGCGSITAAPALAQATAAQASALATALGALYGSATTAPAPFVPLVGSAAHSAVLARIAALKAQLTTFGAASVSAAGPTGAPAPLTAAELQRVLTDSAYGIRSLGLGDVVQRGRSLAVLGATWSAGSGTFDWRGPVSWRAVVRGAVTFAGSPATAADLTETTPRGNETSAVTVAGQTDFLWRDRFGATVGLGLSLPRTERVRYREPESEVGGFPGLGQEVLADVRWGRQVAARLAPYWRLSEAITVGADYALQHRSATNLDAGVRPVHAPRPLSPGGTDHRLGATLSYSALAAHERGTSRWPVEITATHSQSITGAGGYLEKEAFDAVALHWYWRRRAAAAPAPVAPR